LDKIREIKKLYIMPTTTTNDIVELCPNIAPDDCEKEVKLPTIRPLVDTFRMYLCADTDTFLLNVSVPIQIQY